MRRVLWWLIGGTRGGRNRLRIIRTLQETPMNANQLAGTLDLDYKTVQHHLGLLIDNGVLTTVGEDYGKTYFLTDAMETNLDVLEEVARKADLGDVTATNGDPTDGGEQPDDGEGADDGGGADDD
jgi:DNA-binding transcriptional ArsR family regulator